MVLEAIPLIFSPTVIITLLSPDVRESTALEEYLSRSLGITLIAFAILNLLLTGSVPLTVDTSAFPSHRTPRLTCLPVRPLRACSARHLH